MIKIILKLDNGIINSTNKNKRRISFVSALTECFLHDTLIQKGNKMALNTDSFTSLQNEYQFKGRTENWRPATIYGNKLPNIYVGISGTIIFLPNTEITKTTILDSYDCALPTKLNSSCLLMVTLPSGEVYPVHRIVAETFKTECFIYNSDEIIAKPERHINSLENYLNNNLSNPAWVVHHKDNNANNNSVPNLVWLVESDHQPRNLDTHPNNTFIINDGMLYKHPSSDNP